MENTLKSILCFIGINTDIQLALSAVLKAIKIYDGFYQ